MIVAYADPPYLGQAKRHYADHPDYAGEVDHAALIARLVRDYPDGWALSASSNTLRVLLPLCPGDVRVSAWVKPFCAWKPNGRPAYAWEPVIWRGGRPRKRHNGVRDWVAVSMTMRRGLHGVKPEGFCFWLFTLLNLQEGDRFDDLFPGSGAVLAAWDMYRRQLWSA